MPDENEDGERLETLGVSHEKLVAKLRCGAARRLLKHTDMSPAEIAVEVGYADLHTFTSICVLRTGYSPTELRRVTRLV